MAITRAQQAKQMLQDGGMTKKIKGQEHMLAYITPGEADKLVELGGQETMTPEGIPAYPPQDNYTSNYSSSSNKSGRTSSTKGAGGGSGYSGGNNNREQYITDYSSKQKVKGGGKRIGPKGQGFGYEDRDFSDKTDSANREIIDRQRRNYQDQFTSKGIAPPGPNRKERQRALNYLNRNMIEAYNRFGKYYDPNKFGVTKTGYPNFGVPNFYEGIASALAAGFTLDEILENENMIPLGSGPSYEFDKIREEFNKANADRKVELIKEAGLEDLFNKQKGNLKGTSYEMNPVPDLDIDSIRELASTQTTLQGDSLTGYQANQLEKLREGINKRDNLLETGDTSGIFPDPPEPTPDDGPEEMDPCKGPNPPAYCFVNDDDDDDQDPKQVLTPRILGSYFDPTFFAADGGIMNNDIVGGMMDGNMDEMGRQMYGLGKLVKKATRGIKKLVKSPVGKAALIGAGFGFAGMGPFKGLAGSKFGLGTKNFFLNKILGNPVGDFGTTRTGGLLGFIKENPYKSIFAASTLAGLLGNKEDEDDFDIEEYYRTGKIANVPLNKRIAGSDFYFPAADGGIMRTGYQEGGDAEPVAKKTMPLIDMDGKEKDYRETGGFVDMGRMEKADDVPARLSKNEFVFTADAVRNAGDGDIDKGAEVMYNMMKNLESGGDVSEESQGLEGARNMFQTSQRLGEVL